MGDKKSEVLQGTLDLMVLKTLYAMGPLHGFGIARRIEQLSDDVLQLNEGTVYTSLLRLQQQGWIASDGALRKTIARRGTTPLPGWERNNWNLKRRTGSGLREWWGVY